MVILGIDPGYAIVGYGVIDTTKKEMVLDYGAITTPKEDSMPIRLQSIEGALNFLLEKFKPDVVAIEVNLFFVAGITLTALLMCFSPFQCFQTSLFLHFRCPTFST